MGSFLPYSSNAASRLAVPVSLIELVLSKKFAMFPDPYGATGSDLQPLRS